MGFEFPKDDRIIRNSDVKNWPTIIFQLKGYTEEEEDDENKHKNDINFQNKAGILDSENPNDILIALPPSHYMEYNLRNRTYFPRLEFVDHSVSNGP